MHITITYIKLRKWWLYFPLTYSAMKISWQIRREKGYVSMKNTGWGYHHFTMSSWESAEDLKRFARSGAHAAAMKKTKDLANNLATFTYTGNELPDWKTAKDLVLNKGKMLTFT